MLRSVVGFIGGAPGYWLLKRYWPGGKGHNAWDQHGTLFTAYANEFMPELDRSFSALMLDRGRRGMLDRTLVLVTGEFGRLVEINVNNGRDH